MRQIVLDTETTGLEPEQGHRIIEIGCVEISNRRITDNHFHVYLQPDREVDPGAAEVHGISDEFLADKPRFEDIADKFLAYIEGAELIIHNAPFDVGFLEHELRLAGRKPCELSAYCTVTDSLDLARRCYPGQRNSLDALCRRLEVDNSGRILHGALLDAEILADVYLRLTGGQAALLLDSETAEEETEDGSPRSWADRPPLPVREADAAELAAHEAFLDLLDESSGGCLWRHSQR